MPRLLVPSARRYGWVRWPSGMLFLGGSPRGDESAREASWPKLLAFLARISAPR